MKNNFLENGGSQNKAEIRSIPCGRPASKNASTKSILKSHSGFMFFLLCIVGIFIFGVYMLVSNMKQEQSIAIQQDQKRKLNSVKCLRAMREIVKAMDDDKKQTGTYPYHFDDAFYNRHPQTYRYVYNMEIWTKDSNYEVELSTIYGENYVATAYCNDLNTYEYDTRTAKSLTDIQVFRP